MHEDRLREVERLLRAAARHFPENQVERIKKIFCYSPSYQPDDPLTGEPMGNRGVYHFIH